MNGYTGLDLSLTASGIAWFAGAPKVDVTCSLIGAAGVTSMPLFEQYSALIELRNRIVDAVVPGSLVLIESLASAGRSGRMNSGAHERAWLWHDVVGQLTHAGELVVPVNGSTLKMFATGKHNALKTAVVEGVTRRFPEFLTQGDDNLCDASALAAMGSFLEGNQRCSWKLPQTHLKALEKVKAWNV